jgi:hypothetical protein
MNHSDISIGSPNKQTMGKIIYALYTLFHTLTLAWAIWLFLTSPNLSLAVLILVLAGLVYDNFIIYIGDRLQAGELLEALNKGRYWCHGLLSPLLLLVALQVLHKAEVSWNQSPWMDWLTLGLTLCLIWVEVTSRMIKLNLKPVTFAGTLRYKEVVPSRELPVILVILFVGAVGVIAWQSLHWTWMFWGALVMMVGSAIPPTTKAGPSIGSGVEVLFGLSLVATQAWFLGAF